MATTPESPFLFKAYQMSLVKDPEELLLWLKGKQMDNLRACGNPKNRMIGFADISTSDYILCSISALRNKKLNKLYSTVMRAAHNDGEMFNNWLSQIMPSINLPDLY